jgi:hypothetical protein
MSHPRGILSLAVDEDTDQVTPIKAGFDILLTIWLAKIDDID